MSIPKLHMAVKAACRLWVLAGVVLCVRPVVASQTVTEPFLGVRQIHQVESSPRPLQIHAVAIDLEAPGIGFRVTPGGPHPRPIGMNGAPMETIRRAPRQFADSIGAQIAINTSFFSDQAFDGVFWANNLGLTASNGEKYSPWEAPSSADFDDALNITQNNQATIVKMPASIPTGFETNPPVTLYNTVTGSHRLVTNGANVAPSNCGNLCALHPRTAAGLTSDNRLLLLTVDGRQNGFSEGMTLVELANLMLSYGAVDAINLDGGGSTQLAMNFYDDSAAAVLVNSPSQIPERLVGANLAVFAARSGDFNLDGAVTAADYVAWRALDGSTAGYNSWRANFGEPNSGAASSAFVPEPSMAALVGAAAACLIAIRSRRRPTN